MGDGVVIPKWLYQNDLPDDELQAVYVREAEKKWRALHDERLGLEAELKALRQQEQAALAFLNDAREALKKYQRAAEAPADDAPELPFTPRRRALPRPEQG